MLQSKSESEGEISPDIYCLESYLTFRAGDEVVCLKNNKTKKTKNTGRD